MISPAQHGYSTSCACQPTQPAQGPMAADISFPAVPAPTGQQQPADVEVGNYNWNQEQATRDLQVMKQNNAVVVLDWDSTIDIDDDFTVGPEAALWLDSLAEADSIAYLVTGNGKDDKIRAAVQGAVTPENWENYWEPLLRDADDGGRAFYGQATGEKDDAYQQIIDENPDEKGILLFDDASPNIEDMDRLTEGHAYSFQPKNRIDPNTGEELKYTRPDEAQTAFSNLADRLTWKAALEASGASGVLEFDEFTVAANDIGITDPAQIHSMFDEANTDGNDHINFKEWQAAKEGVLSPFWNVPAAQTQEDSPPVGPVTPQSLGQPPLPTSDGDNVPSEGNHDCAGEGHTESGGTNQFTITQDQLRQMMTLMIQMMQKMLA